MSDPISETPAAPPETPEASEPETPTPQHLTEDDVEYGSGIYEESQTPEGAL